ncbi:hypothetical protein CYMTET_4943 [Cymbomonas tetramitiformis]|uniref:Endonuclease/exonuclease/phosphatase domain-containing protein n=1 Tax=Cymbomonas tetramitiformis TaxID=36881 RepID=A0AAE0LJL4_9CHLO|nr:hypothetical protein CYMTET_4943 [Cymbomonas tetramitiformis]
MDAQAARAHDTDNEENWVETLSTPPTDTGHCRGNEDGTTENWARRTEVENSERGHETNEYARTQMQQNNQQGQETQQRQTGSKDTKHTTQKRAGAHTQPDLWRWLHRKVKGPDQAPLQDYNSETGSEQEYTKDEEHDVEQEKSACWEKAVHEFPSYSDKEETQETEIAMAEPLREEIGDDKLNLLTWNMRGQSDACLDLAEVIKPYNVIVLTEVKDAHGTVKRKFADIEFTSIGEQTMTKCPREGMQEAGTRGGVIAMLQNPYSHSHNHHVVPNTELNGYLTHVVLHNPGGTLYHILAVYNPPDREEAEMRLKILEYVTNTITEIQNKENEHVVIGGDLQASNTRQENKASTIDTQWEKLMKEMKLTDVGPRTNTTLDWAGHRNIDRWLAPIAQKEWYEAGGTRQITSKHTSDHNMVCATSLSLSKMGTHEPYVEIPRLNDEQKLKTSLNKQDGETLQSIPLRTHDQPSTAEQGGLAILAKNSREAQDMQMTKITINRAGENVREILQAANDRATTDEQLTKIPVGDETMTNINELIMSRAKRRLRDAAIIRMRVAKKTKRQLKDEKL